MTDISKCGDETCPSRNLCWRYLAPASEFRQSWGSFGRQADDQHCDYFWPVDDDKKTGEQNG